MEAELRVSQAAKEFDVPPTTLKDWMLGWIRYGRNLRPESFLTKDEKKNSFASFLITALKMGHGKAKQELLQIVQKNNLDRNMDGLTSSDPEEVGNSINTT